MKHLLLILFLLPVALSAQIITTVAGGGVSNADNIPATSANLGTTGYLVFDSAGNYYFNHYPDKVRKISPSGIITTVAGTNTAGFSGDGGPASSAQLNFSSGLAFDSHWNLYIGDVGNHRIRKVDAVTGIITTVVGNGADTMSGDGGPAINAGLGAPAAIAFDKDDNMYFCDWRFVRIRKVDTAGIITTIAGNDIAGNTGDNGPAVLAEVAAEDLLIYDNYLYVASTWQVRKINLCTGIITKIAGTDSIGNSGDGGLAINAKLWLAAYLEIDNCGNLYISDEYNDVVRWIDTFGIIRTLAGTGVGGYNGDNIAASTAQLNYPRGIRLDPNGNLIISDNSNNRMRSVSLVQSPCPRINTPCNPESLKNVGTAEPINISPNPAQNEISITGTSIIKDVAIINAIGQMVMRQSCNGNRATINVSGLKEGVYFVSLRDAKTGNVVRGKFVKE